MTTRLFHPLPAIAAAVCLAGLLAPTLAQQPPVESAAAAPAPAAADDAPAFSKEELDQLAAPLALYPDSLLSQIFMASTYPIEVVEADRWVKANPTLKGDALAKELEKQDWDPSVRSLVNFPDVLSMMSENLKTTQKIGDAFLGQQKELMDAVQRLRAKAKAQGNLESNQQQTVKVEQAPAGSQTQTIVIESSSPEVIYVPQYNPTVVYGSWPYPSYPPYPYYPPGYVAGTALAFGVGVACGAAWGYAWGNCNWGGGDVDIDVNRNTNINNNINRNEFKNKVNNGAGKGSWQHDGSHRKGAGYRNSATASKYGGASSAQAARARESYRGRAETGRQDLARGGADQFKGAGGAGGAQNRAGGAGAGAGNRAAPTPANRAGSGSGSAGSRPASSGNRSSGFSGASGSGSSARAASSRGSSSRGSSGGGSRGGGSRGGGGGRGGGGRR